MTRAVLLLHHARALSVATTARDIPGRAGVR